MSEEGHSQLPKGLYKYGEPYASGVRPVYEAHQQTLWFSVPHINYRFTDLDVAEKFVFLRSDLERKDKLIEEQKADILSVRKKIQKCLRGLRRNEKTS